MPPSTQRRPPGKLGPASLWLGAVLIALLVVTPLATVAGTLLKPPGEGWELVADLLLGDYVRGTLVMLSGVGLLTLLIGVPSAWAVTVWRFPGRRFFELALLFPMAMPTYVAAYAYGFLKDDLRDPLLIALRDRWGAGAMADANLVFNHALAIFVLSIALYPYVYIAARVAFSGISAAYIENSRLLGHGLWYSLFHVGVPLARPAIIGGLTLVLLEVLNEYGAMQYFGINTFTTGIFLAWTNMGDADSAARLAGTAMLIVLALIVAERALRGRSRFHAHRAERAIQPCPPRSPAGALLLPVACGGLFALAFVVPLLALLKMATIGLAKIEVADTLGLVGDSLLVALGSGLCILAAALCLAYAARIFPTPTMRVLTKVSMLGYAVPGAVVAVAILATATAAAGPLRAWFGFDGLAKILFTTTPAGLMLAYMIRFLTPALAPVEAGMTRISKSMDEASLLLGRSVWGGFFRIHLPLLRLPVLGALIVLFVDILKELPLTMVLRPFNFETLATQTYGLVQAEERLAEGSVPAVILVLSGLVGVVILNRLITRPR